MVNSQYVFGLSVGLRLQTVSGSRGSHTSGKQEAASHQGLHRRLFCCRARFPADEEHDQPVHRLSISMEAVADLYVLEALDPFAGILGRIDDGE